MTKLSDWIERVRDCPDCDLVPTGDGLARMIPCWKHKQEYEEMPVVRGYIE